MTAIQDISIHPKNTKRCKVPFNGHSLKQYMKSLKIPKGNQKGKQKQKQKQRTNKKQKKTKKKKKNQKQTRWE